jgi:hypothetical protein
MIFQMIWMNFAALKIFFHFGRRTVLQPSAVQEALDFADSACLVGHKGLSEGSDVFWVVGDHNHRDMKTLLDVQELFPEPSAQKGIQGCERLVQEQQIGFRHKGPRQGHALLLAAREVRRKALGKASDLEAIEEVQDIPSVFSGKPALHDELASLPGYDPRDTGKVIGTL